MSGWTTARDAILQQQVAATGVRALVVEGEDDKMIVEAFLDKISPEIWATKWCVGVSNGKQNVLKILDDQVTWLGLVDRDEWSENAANAAAGVASRAGRLHVLPRFCMESYFISPHDIWSALPAVQQKAIQDGEATVDAAIKTNSDSWLRHGALWHAVNPLWDGLQSRGFKDRLLDHTNAQDDALIRQTLAGWHQFLDPQRIFTDFQTHLATARATGGEEQFRRWIHGKRFFNQKVVPTLNQLLGQKSASNWYRDLSITLPVPADLQLLWDALGLP